MAIQLKNSNDLARTHGIKVLTYGKSGLGKTVLVATAPNPVLISAESGLLSLRKDNLIKLFGKDNPTITYELPVIEITTLDDLIDAHKWAQTSKEAKQFDTLCLDSITEIAEKVLANAKAQVKDPRQAYGELIEKMTLVIRDFRDLKGRNVYMSAKEEFGTDEATGVKSYVPSMPGAKLSQQLPYFFDEVFHLGIAKTLDKVEYRYLRTQPDLQYVAKDRSGTLEPIEQPNLTLIFEKILAGVEV